MLYSPLVLRSFTHFINKPSFGSMRTYRMLPVVRDVSVGQAREGFLDPGQQCKNNGMIHMFFCLEFLRCYRWEGKLGHPFEGCWNSHLYPVELTCVDHLQRVVVSCSQVSIGVDVSEVAGCRYHLLAVVSTYDKLTYIG